VGGVTTRYLIDDLNLTGFPQVPEELVSGGLRCGRELRSIIPSSPAI